MAKHAESDAIGPPIPIAIRPPLRLSWVSPFGTELLPDRSVSTTHRRSTEEGHDAEEEAEHETNSRAIETEAWRQPSWQRNRKCSPAEQKPQMAGWQRTTDASDPRRSIRTCRELDNYQSAGQPPGAQGCRATARGVKANTSQAEDFAALSLLQIGLPGWTRSSPALAGSRANVRLYRPQTFMSKRSNIMTLFQAFTKTLTKRS